MHNLYIIIVEVAKRHTLSILAKIQRFPERPSTPQANPPSAANNMTATGNSNQPATAGSMQSPRPVNPPTPKDSATATGASNAAHRNTSAVGYQAIAGQNQVNRRFQMD